MVIERPSRADAARPRNYILARIPEDRYGLLARHLVPVDLPLGMQLAYPHEPVEHVYFPVSGLVSIDALTHGGESVEVSVIGREGFSGWSGLLGQPMMGHSVIMQGAGSGMRIRLAPLRDEFLRGGAFSQLVHTFLYMQIVQMSQSVLCNRLHPVEKRMARWLLTAADRTQSETLQLTQEFLSQMLGSRRSTVTVAAGQLQREGLIDYTRGRVRIVDRTGLEAKACECYHIVRTCYDRIIGHNF